MNQERERHGIVDWRKHHSPQQNIHFLNPWDLNITLQEKTKQNIFLDVINDLEML